MLPELFDHQDQKVRASAKGVTLELCRWIGKDPVKSILFEKMRDTMVRILLIRTSAVQPSCQDMNCTEIAFFLSQKPKYGTLVISVEDRPRLQISTTPLALNSAKI